MGKTKKEIDWSWLDKLNSRNVIEKNVGKDINGKPYDEEPNEWVWRVMIGEKVLKKLPEEEQKKFSYNLRTGGLYIEEWMDYKGMKQKIEKGNWDGDPYFFDIQELLWFFGKPPSNGKIYLRYFKNFTELDKKKFFELGVGKAPQCLQVDIKEYYSRPRNDNGDVLWKDIFFMDKEEMTDKHIPTGDKTIDTPLIECYEMKIAAKKETIMDMNYKVIYSVPDEDNREYKTIADDDKEAMEQFEAFRWMELWVNQQRIDNYGEMEFFNPVAKDFKVISIEKIS